MNIGQIYETVLGWAGQKLGKNILLQFLMVQLLKKSLTNKTKIPQYGHTYLYDGGTGERFDSSNSWGCLYAN